ncbi:MAG: CbiQ family ECF transporter T component [Propionicimonas sp.]|nr:CbiQ family ECF transporter T component [Propionicimonas sp.]
MHPWAWWAWAIGLAIAASATTNPLLLALLAVALVSVVLLRRGHAPWASSLSAYLWLAGFVLVMRLGFQIVMGISFGTVVLFTLPELPLPDWAAGIRLGGPVMAEALLFALYDALRLVVMLLCVAAANSLANPRRALRSVPAALYEASVAVVIALSVAPQLIESGRRVRRARRLRGGRTRGRQVLGSLVIPVLGDAVDRSLALATGMEARGFARTRGLRVRGTLPVMLGSAMATLVGVFGLLGTAWPWPSLAVLVAGVAGMVWGLRRAGARLRITHYRPDRWDWRASCVAASGLLAAVLATWLRWLDPVAFAPGVDPLAWPPLTWPMLLLVGLALLPLPLTAPARTPVRPAARTDVPTRSLRPRADRGLVNA